MDLHAKAWTIVDKALRKLEDENSGTVNGVGIYVDSSYLKDKVLSKTPFMHISLGGVTVTFANGMLYHIENAANRDVYMWDVPAMLNDASKLIDGKMVEVKVGDYELQSPNDTKVVTEKVEVDNPINKTKAEILDQLLGRKITID